MDLERAEVEDAACAWLTESTLLFSKELDLKYEPEAAISLLENFPWPSTQQLFVIDTQFAKLKLSLGETDPELGMNTPGILWDRLTILACKLAFASSESIHCTALDPNSGLVTREQIRDILITIHSAKRAKTSLLAKEQTSRVKSASTLMTALKALMWSNIGMWINQDLLYTKEVTLVPEKRLRDYIKFFGIYNRKRNVAIEEIDLLYSSK